MNDSIRALVAEGSGFIGTNLIELLNSLGYSLLNIDINPPKDPLQIKF